MTRPITSRAVLPDVADDTAFSDDTVFDDLTVFSDNVGSMLAEHPLLDERPTRLRPRLSGAAFGHAFGEPRRR